MIVLFFTQTIPYLENLVSVCAVLQWSLPVRTPHNDIHITC